MKCEWKFLSLDPIDQVAVYQCSTCGGVHEDKYTQSLNAPKFECLSEVNKDE